MVVAGSVDPGCARVRNVESCRGRRPRLQRRGKPTILFVISPLKSSLSQNPGMKASAQRRTFQAMVVVRVWPAVLAWELSSGLV